MKLWNGDSAAPALRAVLASALLVLVISSCASPGSNSTDTSGDGIDQAAADMVACLTDRGWDVEADPVNGGISAIEIPPSQQSAYDADYEECNTEALADLPDFTRDVAEDFYDDLVASGECLKELGYSVPEPPSKQASVDSMLDGDIIDPLWDPYSKIAGSGVWEDALEECPQPQLNAVKR